MPNKKEIKDRLAYLRQEIKAERISQSEIAELQSLAEYIDSGDTLLLEWAGEEEACTHEDKCIYGELGQVYGKPCYVCQCGDCKKHFIIWLEEGKNENFKKDQDYENFKENLI